ncbi:hypothetical protein CH340_23530, partial [Rhodoplanes serenus]
GPQGRAGPPGPPGPPGPKGERGEAAAPATATAPTAAPLLRAVTRGCDGPGACRAACEADEVLITALPIPAERTLTAAAWTGERLPGEVSIVCGRTR